MRSLLKFTTLVLMVTTMTISQSCQKDEVMTTKDESAL